MSTVDHSLARAIADATRGAFVDWRREHPDERVFAIALSTIDDALYVSAALNTEESLMRSLGRHGIGAGSEDAIYRKWYPNEWEYEFLEASHFKEIDGRLNQMYEAAGPDGFEAFRESVFASMIAGLVLLRAERTIPDCPHSERVTFFAMIYDSFDSERIQRASAIAANPPDCITEYLAAK
jgi:hypothetical protein